MAELDPQPVEPIVEAVPVETATVVETVPTVVPPSRPRKIYSGMWGPAEIVVVAAGALALVAVIVFYFLGVVPSSRELARNKSEADRLDSELMSANSKYGEINDTQSQVAKLVESVDDFEIRFLPPQSNGQSALYQRLNSLIAAYGLVNTTGPDYAPLEAADIAKPGQQQTEDEKGRAKYRSLYPGVYVTTTVEGSYQNLRRFIREIETGRDFVVISAIELAPSDTEGQQPQGGATQANGPAAPAGKTGFNQPVGIGAADAQPGGKPGFNRPIGIGGPAPQPQSQPQRSGPKGKMHGEVVALHIELAAYFRRPNFVPATPAEQYQQ